LEAEEGVKILSKSNTNVAYLQSCRALRTSLVLSESEMGAILDAMTVEIGREGLREMLNKGVDSNASRRFTGRHCRDTNGENSP
jgi:hypothetical protein